MQIFTSANLNVIPFGCMISVIIPTYNEADQIAKTITAVRGNDRDNLITEIIVVDGGSSDETIAVAQQYEATAIISERKGRAAQMNKGATLAKGDILYFLHADSLPPAGFTQSVLQAYKQGFSCGCFRLQFDHPHWFLQANAWFTRFDINAIRFGDQSLFVTRERFEQTGGFCETHIVMEDQEIIKRLKRNGKFTVVKKPVLTSARKYLVNGIYRTQGIFFLIYIMYYLGYSQQQLVTTYRKLMVQDKL